MLAGPRQTGIVVNADGLTSQLGAGTVLNATFQWDFGDPSGQHDQIAGFTAAHVYDQPGAYTITLTVTNQDGGVATATQQVTIAASTRNIIYVDPANGSNSNTGAADAPVQTLDQAVSMLGDNTEILLKAGYTYDVAGTIHIQNNNVLIGSYGTGADPILNRQAGNGNSTIDILSSSDGVTIQNLTFDTPFAFTGAAGTKPLKIGLSGVYVGGQNVTVRDCTFLNVDDAINENGVPTGVLIQDNNAPLMTGLRGYFVWGQGSEQTIVGNNVVNSNNEHIVRMVYWTDVTIEGNTFANHDGKGCIEMHAGSYGYVAQNNCTGGDIRVGPLGEWGEPVTDSTSWCVITDNQLTDTFIYAQSGSDHIMIENNVVQTNSGPAITIDGTSSLGVESSDITILHNTAINNGTQGQFLAVEGVVDGITLDNNLWVAPNVQPGADGTAAIYVNDNSLEDFTSISDNIWPMPITILPYANGGINYVSIPGNGYQDPAQWDANSQVHGDVFENVSLGDTYQASAGSFTAGASLPRTA